jgi:hypothetical protein
VPVDEPTRNPTESPVIGLTESRANGVLEATPNLPAYVIVVVAVPPNSAKFAERAVDEAFPLKFCLPVHVLATEKSHEKAPETPPRNEPSVPEYASGEVTVGVEVATVLTLPVEPTKSAPAVWVGRKKLPLMVVDELEKRPE